MRGSARRPNWACCELLLSFTALRWPQRCRRPRGPGRARCRSHTPPAAPNKLISAIHRPSGTGATRPMAPWCCPKGAGGVTGGVLAWGGTLGGEAVSCPWGSPPRRRPPPEGAPPSQEPRSEAGAVPGRVQVVGPAVPAQPREGPAPNSPATSVAAVHLALLRPRAPAGFTSTMSSSTLSHRCSAPGEDSLLRYVRPHGCRRCIACCSASTGRRVRRRGSVAGGRGAGAAGGHRPLGPAGLPGLGPPPRRRLWAWAGGSQALGRCWGRQRWGRAPRGRRGRRGAGVRRMGAPAPRSTPASRGRSSPSPTRLGRCPTPLGPAARGAGLQGGRQGA